MKLDVVKLYFQGFCMIKIKSLEELAPQIDGGITCAEFGPSNYSYNGVHYAMTLRGTSL